MKTSVSPRDGVSELRKHSESRTRHVVFQEERWGSSGGSTSGNVNGGEHQTLHYISALDKMFKAAATLPMTPRCFQNLVFLSPLVTAVNPASLAVASILWLLNRVYGDPGGPMKHAKCILNSVSGYKKSNLSIFWCSASQLQAFFFFCSLALLRLYVIQWLSDKNIMLLKQNIVNICGLLVIYLIGPQ